MSLGLGDLKKKTRATTANATATPANEANQSAHTPAAAIAAPTAKAAAASSFSQSQWTRSKTARPWSDDLTSHAPSAPRARKKPELSDVVINDDFADMNAAPLFWFDPASDSRLAMAQAKLVALEEKVQRAVSGPLQILKALVPGLLK